MTDHHPIVAARRRRALSRVATATATGIERARLVKIEAAEDLPTLHEVRALGAVLGVDATRLHEACWRARHVEDWQRR